MITPIVPCTGACTPWAQLSDICEPCSSFSYDQAHMLNCLQAASDILFQLSGRQFAGSCQDTVQPDPRVLQVDCGRPVRPYLPGLWGGSWGGYGGSWGGYGGGWGVQSNMRNSGCTGYPAVTLGVYPLTGIEQVKIDGAVVDPATYGIKDNYWLVRKPSPVTGRNDGWPTCNRQDLADDHVGTWSVTFDYGMPPPVLGVLAAAELACQLYLAQFPSVGGACQLPQRVTNITRQGIAMVVSDPQKLLDMGGLGLRLCDMFLTAVNPAKLKRRATAFSPDITKRTARWTA